MRLVAQRVRSVRGDDGINAFYYAHGPYVWLDSPPPEIRRARGHLINSHVAVRPPGNRVRSYLEILAPDETSNAKVEQDMAACVDLFAAPRFPLKVQSGDSTFEFDVEQPLAPAWRREIIVLLHSALVVRV